LDRSSKVEAAMYHAWPYPNIAENDSQLRGD
jgi:hypothetical protein